MKNQILGIVAAISITGMAACQKNNAEFNQQDLTNPVSIMPQPPSQWINFTGSTYYSSGFVGDVMPYYDGSTFHIYYLHDGDGNGSYHPIHAFESSDMVHYSYDGKMLAYGSDSAQDRALGTGSVIKIGSTYYFYYTGHNDLNWTNGKPVEGVMYATSTDLKTWTKKQGFDLVPSTGYDANDFRDPFVYYDSTANQYTMLVAARQNGKPVTARYTTKDPSTDNWAIQSPFYIADNAKYSMMECPDFFHMGNYYYLVFSENYVNYTTHYRIATSPNGPWTTPANDVLDGAFFYAGKTATDGKNRYLFGWSYRKDGANDYGGKVWGGNLIVHQLVQNSDGTLSTINPQTQAQLFTKTESLQPIDINNANGSNNDYTIQSNGTVHFGMINGQKKITTTISGLTGSNDAGFVFGWARAGSGDYYKVRLQSGVASIVKVQPPNEYPDASIPYKVSANGDINLEVLIDNSSFVVNINGNTSLTGRSYWLPNAQWGLYSNENNVTFKQLNLFGY